MLTPGDGAYDQKRLRPHRDRFGQWGVGRFVGEILLASEEPHERPALFSNVIAERSAEHRIAGLERVKD